MLQLAGLPPLRSSQIVGGTVNYGAAGPYTTDFTLSPALVDVNKAIAIYLHGAAGGNAVGNSQTGDYFNWAFTANNNLRVSTLRETFALAKQFWLVLEFYYAKGKVSPSTNVTGTAAADFDVTIAPPVGASLLRMIAALTCVPLGSGGNAMGVGLTVPNLTTARFGMIATPANVTKPVQADILFL